VTLLHVSNEQFRELAERVVAMAADFYAELDRLPTFPQASGLEVQRCFEQPLPEQGLGPRALDAFAQIVAMSRPPSPRFFAYVMGSGEPVAALADLLASVLNQNLTAWRSAPAAVTIERQIVDWIAAAIGCPGFGGSLCGGGSSANLMGLAMAREAVAPANETGAGPGAVYASSEAHMSIGKSVALLGLGRGYLRTVAVDGRHRMRTDDLDRAIAADIAAGLRPIAVVATAGTVNTGAVDPLEEIAGICRRYRCWLHVDGAYGAPVALVDAAKFRGLDQASSLSIDLHKGLYQPIDCGMLLYRDSAAARAAFTYSGDYVRVLDAQPLEQFAFFDESMELSRRFRALKVWLSLRYHGMEAFRAAIRADLAHAQRLAAAVTASPELELMAPVEFSAVCFRHRGSSADGRDLDGFNQATLKRVIANGVVYISNATIRGSFALRACFVNHRTRDADVDRIVPEVLAAAREVIARR
jgi:glutamate/tyrosine decarboxylase-like PLP-dependent enzyme